MCGEGVSEEAQRACKTVESADEGERAELAERNYKVKPCALCGKDFKPHSSGIKYCSRCHPKMQRAWARKSAANAKWKRYLERELPAMDFMDAQHSPEALI